MLVMIAKIAQMSELNHNASAAQTAFVLEAQGRLEKAAPTDRGKSQYVSWDKLFVGIN